MSGLVVCRRFKLCGQGVGRGAKEIGDVAIEPFVRRIPIRLHAGLFDREGQITAFTLARFFRWTSHPRFSLLWHEGILKETA